MRRFKTGEDLAQFIKEQLGVEIKVDKALKGKPRKGIVYMEIPYHLPTLSLLNKIGVKLESHMKNNYFVYLV
jgi:hypothetical protein